MDKFIPIGALARVIVNDIEWKIGQCDRKPIASDYADYFAARRLIARGRGAEARELMLKRSR